MLTDRFKETFGVESAEQLEAICNTNRTNTGVSAEVYNRSMAKWAALARCGYIKLMPSTCAARVLHGIGGSQAQAEEAVVGGIAAMLIGDDTPVHRFGKDNKLTGSPWPRRAGEAWPNGQWHRNLVYYGAYTEYNDILKSYGFKEVSKFNNPTGARGLSMLVLTL